MLQFSRIRDVKPPMKANDTDAGIDFFVPKFDDAFVARMKEVNPLITVTHDSAQRLVINLFPHERVLIPSGIKVKVPEGYALIAYNKSGVSSKLGLDVLAAVVDEGYQGEMHLSVVNTSHQLAVKIEADMKLVQYLLLPVPKVTMVEVPADQLFTEKSTRGEGGFGSSGT